MPDTIINGVPFKRVTTMTGMTINKDALTRILYKRGMNMQELNTLAKISANTIAHAVKYQRQVRPATAQKIAKALNCDPLDFLQEMPTKEGV